MANWTNEPQPFGPNHIPLLAGVSSSDGKTAVPVSVDPATGALLTSTAGGVAGSTAVNDGVTTTRKATVANLTNSNPLAVEIVDGSGTQITSFGGGTQYTDANATPAHPIGTMPIFDNGGTLAKVSAIQGLPVNIVGGGGGGLSVVDAAAWTTAVSAFTPSGGVFNDTAAVLTAGQQGTLRLTNNRAVHSNLRNAAGTEIGTSSNPIQVSLANTAANGTAVKVDGTGGTFPISGTVSITANSAVNISQINAVTPLMGNGLTGTGSLRVTIASDNTAFAVNATLSAETTKVIGTVRTADGSGNLLTTNSTTYTAKNALDGNLLGTLGTAFSTAGKVDVKGADGDVFVRQATGTNLHTVIDSGTITAVTSITNALPTGTNTIGSVKLTNGTNVMDVQTGTYGKPGLVIRPHDTGSFSDGYANNPTNYVDENFNQIIQPVFGFNFNGTTWDRTRTSASAATTTGTGLLGTGPLGIYNSTAPSVTAGNYERLQLDSSANLKVNLNNTTTEVVDGRTPLDVQDVLLRRLLESILVELQSHTDLLSQLVTNPTRTALVDY